MRQDALHNDDDAARLFRESDNVGSDSSLWLRALRQLLKDGKPVGPIQMLTVSLPDQQRSPLGVLSQTKKNRLIFWPPLPPDTNMICDGESPEAVDHVTLEFPSEKIHTTAYDAKGRAVRNSRAWKLHHLDDFGLALWFYLLVRIPVLRKQDLAVQRRVPMPKSDEERRLNEFRHSSRTPLDIPLPHHNSEQDYIYFGFFLARDLPPADQFPSERILPADNLNSQIEGGRAENTFETRGLKFSFENQIIVVAAACPPGRLLSDVTVGFSGKRKPEDS